MFFVALLSGNCTDIFSYLYIYIYIYIYIPRKARAEGPSIERLINMLASGAKPREFKQKICFLDFTRLSFQGTTNFFNLANF